MTADSEEATGAAIRVTNISGVITEEILREFFTHLGPLKSLEMAPAAIKFAGENHQESVVVFERAEDARLALHLTGTKLAERKLMIQPYQLPQQITRKPPARQQQQQHQRVLDLVALGRTLLINRLSREVKETELERVLFQGLQVKSIRLIVSDSTAIGEQKALVEFSTVEDAKNGLDRNGKQFKGTVLEFAEQSDVPPVVESKSQVVSVAGSPTAASISRESEDRRRSNSHRERERSRSRERRSKRSRSPSERSHDHNYRDNRSGDHRDREDEYRRRRRHRSRSRDDRGDDYRSSRHQNKNRSRSRERYRRERSRSRERRRR